MNCQTHKICTWTELANVLIQALELSDPKSADPIGTVTFERISGGIVHMTVNVDLVPMMDNTYDT